MVGASALYARGYQFQPRVRLFNKNCDLAQLAEHYPDTVKVDGSIPSVTTALVRNKNVTGPTEWMNSSAAERRLVKPGAEKFESFFIRKRGIGVNG